MLPEVISDETEERTSASGGNLIFRKLRIKYHFVAEDGSEVTATVQGEGMDSGDKASNKAMAIGHKYALLQVFLIPTEEQKDPDYESPESSTKKIVSMPKKTSIPTPDDPRTIPVTASPLPSAGLGKITEKEKADFLAKVQKMKKDCPPDDWARLITDFGEPDNIDTIENSNMFKKTLSGFVNAWLAKQNVISY